jgi:hypothetical protein
LDNTHKTSDDKLHELATVYLLWQQQTETSVWFDDVGISEFHKNIRETEVSRITHYDASVRKWALLLCNGFPY